MACRPNPSACMRLPTVNSGTSLPPGGRGDPPVRATFLRSPDGAFYTSQDADLVKGQHSETYFALGDAARRRKLGMPAVDRHIYARENGWMIDALATAYAVTGERAYLDDALPATRWILAHRALPGGGFRHDDTDAGGPYLDDTLAMGEASWRFTPRRQSANGSHGLKFGALHRADLPGRNRAGLSERGARGLLRLRPNVDENIPLARFANLLAQYTGDERIGPSRHAMRFLATEQVATYRSTAPGILLAAFEFRGRPLHITIVGGKHAARRPRCSTARPCVARRVPPDRVVGPARGRASQCRCRVSGARSPGRVLLRPGPVLPPRVHAGWPPTPWLPDWDRRPAPRRAHGRQRRDSSARIDGTLTWPDPARDIPETPTTRSSARAVHTLTGRMTQCIQSARAS